MHFMVYGPFASSLKPKEHVLSISIEQLSLNTVSNLSFRKACELLNRILHRAGNKEFKPSTLVERVEAEGTKIHTAFENNVSHVLQEAGFDPDTGLITEDTVIPESVKNPAPSDEAPCVDKVSWFKETIDAYNEGKDPCDQISLLNLVRATEVNPDNAVYVSIDDVGVDQQKDKRKNGGLKTGKVIENTVIHVQSKEGEYTITAIGMQKAFKYLMAFLLDNHLLCNRHLYFFSDGARNIRSYIEKFFSFCPYTLMLDWYHLEKRLHELLSMALKGPKDERHLIRDTLNHKLWAGNIDEAITYLQSLESKYIKNSARLQDAVDYLNRKRDYIACYALRKELGYKNSSNSAEKANDLVVANRQKHNGMAWSTPGSGALAVISSLDRNDELDQWVSSRQIRFSPVVTADAA